jgi:hypothetical protein
MLKKIAIFAGLAVVLAVVLGVIDLILLTTPAQLHAQLAAEISDQLDADLELDSIEHSLFSTRVHIGNMRLRSRGKGGRVFFSAEKAELTLNYLSFLGGSSLERAAFEKPVVTIHGGEEDAFKLRHGNSLDSILRACREAGLPKLEFRDATVRLFPAGSSEAVEFGGLDLEVDPSSGGDSNSLQFSYVFANGKHLRIRAEIDSDTGLATISSIGDDNYIFLTDRLHGMLEGLSREEGDFAWRLLDTWDYLGAGGEIQVGSLEIKYDPSKEERDRWSCAGRLYLQDVSMEAAEFPYRLVRMKGRVDIGGDNVTLSDMGGFNEGGDGYVSGEGKILNFLSSASDVDLTIHTKNIPFDEKLREALRVEPDIQKMWDDIRPRGRSAEATAWIRKRPEQKKSAVELEMNFDGRAGAAYAYKNADGGEQTLEVSKVNGRVRFSREKIAIDAGGEIGGVMVEVEDGVITRPGMPDGEMDLTAAADFEVTEKVRSILPAGVRREVESAGVIGRVGLTVRLTKKKEDDEPAVRVEVKLLKAGLFYTGFPYKLDDVEGSIIYEGGRIEFRDIRAVHGGAELAVSGSITDLSGEAVYDIEIHGKDVPLDTALYRAMPTDVRGVWDEYVPKSAMEEGTAARATRIDCRIRGRGAQPDVSVDVHATGGTVRYVHFPYTVTDVSGLLRVRPEGVYLEGIRGRHGGVQVSLDRGEILNGKVDIKIVTKDVVLEKDLRDALGREFQEAYDSLQPKGTVDALVQVTQKGEDEELKTEITITSEGTLEFTYREFPMPAKEVVTEVFIGATGIHVKKLACKLGKAVIPLDEERPNNCFIPFDEPRFRMHIRKVEGIEIDEELKKALPEGLSKALNKIKARGRVDLEGFDLNFLVGENDGLYDCKFTAIFNNCSLGDKPLIDRINGRMDLHVRNKPGEYTDAAGSSFSGLDFYIRGFHISDLTGKIERKDAREVSFKNSADPHRVEFTAGAYGGNGKSNMTGHFTFCLGESKEYEGAFKFHGVDLAALEAELSGKDAKMKGKMSGDVRFSGEGENMANIVGGGSMNIEDGDLGQLPIVYNLNQLLRGDLPRTQVVNEAHLKFEIKEGIFDFRQVEFKSQAVRFIGYGQVKFDETIRMTIFSDTVLRGVPVLEDIMKLFKKGIYAAEVKGTFTKPKIGPAPLLKRITDIPEDLRKAIAGVE